MRGYVFLVVAVPSTGGGGGRCVCGVCCLFAILLLAFLTSRSLLLSFGKMMCAGRRVW
jgi:hypothetical protein